MGEAVVNRKLAQVERVARGIYSANDRVARTDAAVVAYTRGHNRGNAPHPGSIPVSAKAKRGLGRAEVEHKEQESYKCPRHYEHGGEPKPLLVSLYARTRRECRSRNVCMSGVI